MLEDPRLLDLDLQLYIALAAYEQDIDYFYIVRLLWSILL
jgi:hypothetical protein